MDSAAYLARLQIRRRWRSLVVIAVLIAVVGGIAASLIAGSCRSQSVVRRYLDATIPYDLQTGVLSFAEGPGPLPRSALMALPGVVRADADTYFGTNILRHGKPGQGINGVIYDRDAIDPTFRVLEGKLPRADDRNAVIVNESFVRQFGLHPGDHLTVRAYSERDLDDVFANRYTPHGPDLSFRVAAVIRSPLDIALDQQRSVRGSAYGDRSVMFISDRFYEANRSRFLTFADTYDVQLDSPKRRAAFEAAVTQFLARDKKQPFFGPARFSERRTSLETPVGLESTALLILGIATALAGAVVTAMLLRAERRAHEQDAALVRALGATRRELGVVAVLRTAPFAALGAAFALLFALALSARYPIGVGWMLELDRGFDVNVAVLAIATAATFVFTTACIAFAFEFGTRSTRRATSHRARAGIDRVLARNGAPLETVIGTHLSFDRGERSRSVPTRPAIAGGAVAIAIVVALGVMLAGRNNLYSSRDAHGWPWDAVIGNTNFEMTNARETKLKADPRVTAATSASYGQATIGRISTEVLAYDPAGDAPPAMLSGRLPRAADEIAPGAKLLHELHAHIGSKVRFSVANSEFASENVKPVDRMLTVVGVSIAPVLGESEFGEVAVVPREAIRAAGGNTNGQLVLARLRPNRLETVRGLSRDYTPDIAIDTIPSRIVNLHRTGTLPILGALLAGVLGTVLLAYTLAVSGRARTRQLGVLRALGMTSKRVGRVLIWQGVALALAITVIGIPIGLVLGSILWRVIADSFGVSGHPTLSPWILLLVPLSIVVGVVASLVPARRARRVDVSQLLHAE